MKKGLKIIIGILLIIGIGIGGFTLMQKIEHDQMVEIVKSEEVRGIIEDSLYYIDSDSFTEKGVIKSYKIDEDDIRHNPMGGINFSVYVNGKKELYIRYTITKNLDTGKVEYSGGGYSGQLQQLIEEKR